MIAITRPPGARFADCELTYLERRPIDLALAREQHAAYCAALQALGVSVRVMPPDDALPDACFVEDTALVLDEVAIVARPGARSRQPEVESIAPVLGEYLPIERITAPATVDGGDVLRVGRTIYAGHAREGGRTNREGSEALARIIARFGYEVRVVPFDGCLHLQSAVTAVGAETLLFNPQWVDPAHFRGLATITVDAHEPNGANALAVGAGVVMPRSAPRTADRVRQAGYDVTLLDISEFEKAEAGVTCLSLLIGSGETGREKGTGSTAGKDKGKETGKT